ncbi:PilW family protein [Gilvimarinus algae]|uniref:Prepilin-type N-terminal cleavage/methylation domain-containing protein n=1 Tax=Gilvimarinus algae TaxID=3058037 RepID=A0ABT8THQ2_9GAMM|nr:prepilin-type N-terminal cleavage/methylation domain-containing protein [Gilvimarinus sp. SDUM040014]MDO3383004.1 prepilin-type N-terminal cleavage/methylation domain-containing protein [Gilvimarinus sp. SDUM040014]
MRRAVGFTLIELITVIVIVAVVAVIGTQFIVSAMESYQLTQNRARLAATGRQAIERISRQIRAAMPYSLRATNTDNCVQFMPLAAGGFYRQPVPTDTPVSSLSTSPYTIDFDTADYIAIGALSAGELYGTSPRSLAAVTATAPTSVSFASHTWQRNSESQRFYLVGRPQAFCLVAGELRFYQDLDPAGDNVSTGAPYSLLARNAVASATPAFVVSGNTAENNFRVTLNLGFAEGGEQVDFFQEVALRNVP